MVMVNRLRVKSNVMFFVLLQMRRKSILCSDLRVGSCGMTVADIRNLRMTITVRVRKSDYRVFPCGLWADVR